MVPFNKRSLVQLALDSPPWLKTKMPSMMMKVDGVMMMTSTLMTMVMSKKRKKVLMPSPMLVLDGVVAMTMTLIFLMTSISVQKSVVTDHLFHLHVESHKPFTGQITPNWLVTTLLLAHLKLLVDSFTINLLLSTSMNINQFLFQFMPLLEHLYPVFLPYLQ